MRKEERERGWMEADVEYVYFFTTYNFTECFLSDTFHALFVRRHQTHCFICDSCTKRLDRLCTWPCQRTPPAGDWGHQVMVHSLWSWGEVSESGRQQIRWHSFIWQWSKSVRGHVFSMTRWLWKSVKWSCMGRCRISHVESATNVHQRSAFRMD